MRVWKFILIYFTLFYHINLYAQISKPDTVKIGAFISSLHNFDIANNSVNADIHIWCIYNDINYKFEKEIEFLNCDEFKLYGTSIQDLDNQKWFYTKAIIKSRQKFSTKSYPFDSQKLIFSLESSEYSTNDFVFKVDKSGSKLDSIIYKQFDEWEINDATFSSTSNLYNTSFGDPSESSTSSPRFDILITINRVGSWLILFKLLTGIIVAFLISSCVFWIKPNNTDPRFGLCVGGLFASIGNKYIVESIIPSTNELTLLDHLHNITFISIFFIIVISVVSLYLFEHDNDKYKKISIQIDLISYFLLNIFYFTFIFYFIYKFS